MKYPILACICGLAFVGDAARALHLNLKGKSRSIDTGASDGLHRRGNLTGLSNNHDLKYFLNLTLGGVSFTTMIDTGSSDTWVAGSVPGSKLTGFNSSVSYAVGAVRGPIKTAELKFAGWTVPDQAYLEVKPDDENAEGSGLIGLGPSSSSNIHLAMGNKPEGNPILDRIFKQDTSTPNYLTVLMGRSNDPSDRFPGDITVGEILTGYEDVSNQPKLAVTEVSFSNKGNQHWQLLLDEDGVYGPDGKPINITSVVDGTSNKKQATAVLDTGFSLPQVPKAVADAIYSGAKGAEYTNIQGLGNVWIVPCTEEINLSFKFGGIVYPIHPLDVVMDASDLGFDMLNHQSGVTYCLGAFQPVSFDVGKSPPYDIILGMAFLRNAYTMINFGDFVDGTLNTRADPYIQMLAITNDTKEAHDDFVKVRLGGVDNGKTPNDTQKNNGSASSSSSSSTSSAKGILSKYLYYIIGGAAAVVGLILISICICLRSRKRKHAGSTGGWKRGGGAAAYAPLHDPAPNAAMDLHAVPSGHESKYSYDANSYNSYNSAPYNPPAQGRYSNPFDGR